MDTRAYGPPRRRGGRGHRDGGDAVKVYFDDLPPEERERMKARYTAELLAIGEREYPVSATFMGEAVTVRGPVYRFPQYNEACYGTPTWRANFQLLCRWESGPEAGDGFIGFGTSLYVNGVALITRTPPWRHHGPAFAPRNV